MGQILTTGILSTGVPKSTMFSITLAANSWNNSQYTISHEDITATNVIEMYPGIGLSDTVLKALTDANIISVSQTTGELILKATKVPTVDATVILVIRKDT